MRVDGLEGELRRGYQLAARLGPWQLRPLEPAAMAEEAYVVTVRRWTFRNEFWLAEGPEFELRLRVGWMIWRWPAATLLDDQVAVIGKPLQEEGRQWAATAS